MIVSENDMARLPGDYQKIFEKEKRKMWACKLKVMLDTGAKMPTKAHDADAGFDLYAREDKTIPARGSASFDTGVHIAIPEGMAGILMSKSGLNVKHGITSTGLIDSGYTGSIVVKLYNNSDTDYTVRAGDKITQIVPQEIVMAKLEQVDQLKESERGNNGFGSTGR